MTIIGILGALVMPALQSTGANALTGGGNQVSDLAMLARNNAIAHNSLTALVVVGNAGTDLDYRAFAVFELPSSSNGSLPVSSDWQMISRWEILPSSIVVDAANSSFVSSPAVTPPLTDVKFRGQNVGAYNYQIFLPDGRLLNSSTSNLLRLVQGTFAGGQISYHGPSGSNYYNIIFLGGTGRLKIIRP